MSVESASLVLRTCDLTFGSTTPLGFADQYGTTYTWNNINLRVLLGDMYYKYDRFNLNLNTIATGTPYTNWELSSLDDRCVYISITGLPWVNNTYIQKTNSNTTSTIIASCYFNDETHTIQYFYYNNSATFIKNQDMCNFSLSLLRIDDGLKPTVTVVFPPLIFLFDITGIENYRVKDITESRIIK